MAIALGGDCLADVVPVWSQPELFGMVASHPTISRLIDALGDEPIAAVAAIRRTRAAARAAVWRQPSPIAAGSIATCSRRIPSSRGTVQPAEPEDGRTAKGAGRLRRAAFANSTPTRRASSRRGSRTSTSRSTSPSSSTGSCTSTFLGRRRSPRHRGHSGACDLSVCRIPGPGMHPHHDWADHHRYRPFTGESRCPAWTTLTSSSSSLVHATVGTPSRRPHATVP
jgi:hypothetical protein